MPKKRPQKMLGVTQSKENRRIIDMEGVMMVIAIHVDLEAEWHSRDMFCIHAGRGLHWDSKNRTTEALGV